MALPTTMRVQTCMGCIPLQRGTIILGYLDLFSALIEILKYILVMVNFEVLIKQCQEGKLVAQSNSSDVLLENLTVFDMDRNDGHLGPRKCLAWNMILLFRFLVALKAVAFVIFFILTALMIHGAKMGKPNLMVPWLWWQLAEITLAILGLFGLGRGIDSFLTNIFIIIMIMYCFLVVNSYYQQLREEAACSAGVTVVAVTHPCDEMTVTLPSPRKDDPPPPYQSFTSGYNPAYNPTDSTGFPDHPAPPYTPSQNYQDSPPPYPGSSPYLSAQVTQTIPMNQELYSSGNASNEPSDIGGEVAPLVENSLSHVTRPNQTYKM